MHGQIGWQSASPDLILTDFESSWALGKFWCDSLRYN